MGHELGLAYERIPKSAHALKMKSQLINWKRNLLSRMDPSNGSVFEKISRNLTDSVSLHVIVHSGWVVVLDPGGAFGRARLIDRLVQPE